MIVQVEEMEFKELILLQVVQVVGDQELDNGKDSTSINPSRIRI